MFRVDLHTHSIASPDGGLSAADYERILDSGQLDCIAVTDHNTTDFARELHKKLGDKIIIGEEITTQDGEIIGLFLRRTIPAGLTLQEAVQAIQQQGGLVYVPHPFETVRSGLPASILDTIADEVDIIEVKNGRAVFQNRSAQAADWAANNGVCGSAASDAHGRQGWGRSFSVVNEMPNRDNLVALLSRADHHSKKPGVRGVLYPKMNRLRKKVSRHAA